MRDEAREFAHKILSGEPVETAEGIRWRRAAKTAAILGVGAMAVGVTIALL